MQHIVEMHANIGRQAEGLTCVPLPAFHIPVPTGRDVGKLDVVFGGPLLSSNFRLEIKNSLVMAQLEDVIDSLTGFFLNERQLVKNLRCRHQRFFANHITA